MWITTQPAVQASMAMPLASLAFLALLAAATPLRAATWTVTSLADGDSTCPSVVCTLRQALANANTGDIIEFAPGVSTVYLLQVLGPLDIDKSVTIRGPGANLLTVQRYSFPPTIDPIFRIAGPSIVISGITISGGGGSGISVQGGGLTISGCMITGNSVFGAGGGINNSGGSVLITDTTISDNTARNSGGGGGIYNSGSMTIINSTITGNHAPTGPGGGINGSGLTILNSTIAFNSAQDAGGIGSSSTTIRNSIVAKNTAASSPDLINTVQSQGFNLFGSKPGFIVMATDQIGVDPLLDTLKDNGGPTKTLALLSGSPAIDKGHSSGSSSDQRGRPRPVDSSSIPNATGGDGADIGAFEFGVRLDIDDNGGGDALTDGLLALRYLFGLTGTSLTSGAIGPSAKRTSPQNIVAFLDANRQALDIDGNGNADALTDGLLILRYLFGLRGSALIIGAVDPQAARKTAADIEAYLLTLMH